MGDQRITRSQTARMEQERRAAEEAAAVAAAQRRAAQDAERAATERRNQEDARRRREAEAAEAERERIRNLPPLDMVFDVVVANSPSWELARLARFCRRFRDVLSNDHWRLKCIKILGLGHLDGVIAEDIKWGKVYRYASDHRPLDPRTMRHLPTMMLGLTDIAHDRIGCFLINSTTSQLSLLPLPLDPLQVNLFGSTWLSFLPRMKRGVWIADYHIYRRQNCWMEPESVAIHIRHYELFNKWFYQHLLPTYHSEFSVRHPDRSVNVQDLAMFDGNDPDDIYNAEIMQAPTVARQFGDWHFQGRCTARGVVMRVTRLGMDVEHQLRTEVLTLENSWDNGISSVCFHVTLY